MSERPATPLDPGTIVRVLVASKVDFVVVGGLAGVAHGSAYPTYDLDVAYARDSENLDRMARALHELEVKLTNAPDDLPLIVDAKMLENGANFTFDTPHGRFDILGHVPGIARYEDLRSEAVLYRLAGVEVRVASIDHLIAMKRAANRIKDRLMLEEYLVIADEQRKLSG